MERNTLDQARACADQSVAAAAHALDLSADLGDSAYLRAYRLAAVQGGRMPVDLALTWAARHWPLFMPDARPWPRTVADAELAARVAA